MTTARRHVRPIMLARTAVVALFTHAVGNAQTLRAQTATAATEPSRYESANEAPVNSWWLPTPDGGTVVFDALRTLSDARAAVRAIEASHRPVRGIFLTHPHPDHVTGLQIYKKAFPGTPVYSTTEATTYLAGKGKTLLRMNVKARDPGDATVAIPAPDVRLTDGQRVAVGGLTLQVRLLGSGESPGATVYFVPSMQTLVTGDILTPGRIPLLAAGQTRGWLRQIRTLRDGYPASTRVLPGHGPATRLDTAASWQESYLTSFRAAIAKAVDPASEAGACVSPAESQRALVDVRRAHPTEEQVARMPLDALNALNVEGVSWELSGRSCSTTKNPVR